MRRGVAWMVATGIAAAPWIAFGADAPEPATAASAANASLPIRDGVLELSLADAVRLAIQRNLDVELLRFDPLVAQEDLGSAWGAYDPELFGEGGVVDSQQQSANGLQGVGLFKDRIWDGRAGFRGLVPWIGASYEAYYSNQEEETTAPFALLSPQNTGSYQALVQIPLLRGLFWDPIWTQVRLARIGVAASDEQFRAQLMDVVQHTEDGYWALLAAQDERRVAEKSLETAKALLEQTQAQYEVGVVSKVEVVQAEAGVADREFRLITADAVERNTQDALIDAVLGPYLEPETELTVNATDRPEEITIRAVSTTAATEHAMARRPEIELARKDIERRKIEVAAASNARLPQLDVVGSFGQNGISGSPSDHASPFFGGTIEPGTRLPGTRWDDANNDLFTTDAGRTYTVRGLLSIPLGNNTARHQHDKAKLELRRSETALTRLEQSIVSEIRRSARVLRSSVEGIDAAARGEAAAAEQLRAERIRLEHGESTPFDVLQREEDLIRAQAQKIAAEKTYHSAISALDRAQGTILDRHHIVIDDAATLR